MSEDAGDIFIDCCALSSSVLGHTGVSRAILPAGTPLARGKVPAGISEVESFPVCFCVALLSSVFKGSIITLP